MSSEIERAAEDLTEAARAEGRLSPFRRTLPTEYNDATMQTANARARLLAFLAPEPEPSEREIEAGAKALEEWQNSNGASLEDLFSDDRVNMDAIRAMRHAEQCQQAKAVLLAARAVRQTGGEA